MLIIGKISGIQDYLFDVAAEGGAQAKRLRARSFFMQVLTETLAIRTAEAFGLKLKASLVFCNAGKFTLEDKSLNGDSVKDIRQRLSSQINRELLRATTGRLSFSIVVSKLESNSIEADYNEAMRELNFAKKRAWANAVSANGAWDISKLVLTSINEPCDLCRQEISVETQPDDDDSTIIRKVCQTCKTMREIGKDLTARQKNWIVLSPNTNKRGFNVGSWSFSFTDAPAKEAEEYLISLNGTENSVQKNDERILSRRLVRSIPKDIKGKPIEFVELAKKAKGDALLGLLKMDADSLGKHIGKLNKNAKSLQPLTEFSQKLDDFFAENLTEKLLDSEIYTVFAGGDDLMLVGAWNAVFDFAGKIQKEFAKTFGEENLTISGGLAIFKPKMPIKNVAAEAEELLERAKNEIFDDETENRNQFAAFGQVWKWKDHEEITNLANQIISWIEEGKFQRGWLNTLLRLAMMRQKNPTSYESRLATARLANFWMRNFRDSEVWNFGKDLVNEFDEMKTVKTKYLAAIARYALTATRSKTMEESE